jgi:hypothetical protein
LSPNHLQIVPLVIPAVQPTSPALAVIDGSLCQFTREGVPAHRYEPIATAVAEFRCGPMCIYVREHPYGLLPGISNLYCLDGALRLLWLAEWPGECGACTRIVDASGDVLTTESASGATVRIRAHTGALLGVDPQMAAAG